MKTDLVIASNNVFTGLSNEALPLAVGIKGDKICWVRPLSEVPADENVLHLGDAFLMPGFHDAHLHFFHSALYASPLACRIVGRSEEDCVRQLAPLAARRPEGTWLLAQGWREALWDIRKLPSKRSLDEAYPNRPIAMYSGDAHTLWLNSRALAELGITPSTPAPAGGEYAKDADGNLTGIVREAAAMELMPKIVASFDEEELLDAYRSFIRHLNASGVTSVCDMALAATPGLDFVRDDLFSSLFERGELTVRTHLFPTLLSNGGRLGSLKDKLHHPLLQACGHKQFFDGVSSQHTAWLHDPYSNANAPDDRGRPTVAPEVMEEMVAQAVRAGEAVRIHVIGDEAIHQALNIYERAKGSGSMPFFALEHLENFQPDDIERLAKAGVIASVQPRHITLDPGGPERDLGDERVPFMWPFRSLIDAGATLAFGTDSPVTGVAPLDGVYTAVTRKDAATRQPEGGWLPEERISVAEALKAYTAGSAAAAGRQHELGTLEPGKFADMVVLDRSPLEVDAEDIPGIQMLKTFVGGREAYSATAER
ncbi:MAG: amidohydrolase [Eggerthellaceae bacterium]|nr:amidohydrolase [Eggerthellaceae bacterium]